MKSTKMVGVVLCDHSNCKKEIQDNLHCLICKKDFCDLHGAMYRATYLYNKKMPIRIGLCCNCKEEFNVS